MSSVKKKRVIVDTNCWISYLIGKRLSLLTTLLCDEHIELILCEELLAEIEEVTKRPKFIKYFPKEEVASLLSFLRLKGYMIKPTSSLQLCRDEADNFLLNMAQDAKAHYLVTGDNDLLVLKKIGTCSILDVKAFENEIHSLYSL